ncbi:hypothetical protein TGPRC2_265065 [Toxoplasma gondii TgCatPRC2]|uniref:Uncharacterized protein n=15 Tax=Toxoplasma gondii TaxID=5811 RepID=A0A125YSV8_TOXGV|nr:hypothetical protein TGME49_265065 [Toxoplasma gondii ME49]EPR57343.1 hypothetical protein TGGT1_265065 [Toxoplasma gondii GT1]ESS33632.1 hypothetical protein TGVEG_265065 [Toxoplasma gondii VEG]KAF4644248.1 hypothetical protein TGRH88_012400 [Toxoplasma gondii]KFG32695.1 hypothetical protein TGP89_265065 [Toxoplasma gondii p89]KFG38529.1 hypothetical protein TGDOM2_265065 [Toxoplasma gondii GAB2-2007-GAL-DOM2]KFG42225.1 hypothetical protein TGFOU_265065 [Toxoplasma gondii FOU]KFG58276.1 |eukprot:XP_018636312.1 hypothetical protein TGME49_265065 [Toxoplasma gondii ME49]
MMDSAATLADAMDRRLTAFENKLEQLSRPVSVPENSLPDASGITSVSWRRQQRLIGNTPKANPPQRFRKPRVLVRNRAKDNDRLLRAIQKITIERRAQTYSCITSTRPLQQ